MPSLQPFDLIHPCHQVAEFLTDFRLIIQNCKTFNEPGSVFYKAALTLSKFGEKFIAKEARNIEGYVDLEDSKETFEETVNGTNEKYGFAN